ncbi:MAG: phospholipid carrier-dependent glycosyltransferase [Anaerolineae bacterium]|nr:phospholipid carrier-dependent glycosyltransferase [Anaerolineae bacterium]
MAKINRASVATDGVIAILLFGLALWLRATDLAHFVTADEHNWIYRSGVFLHAFLTGDYPGTSVWLTPGVTTTWLGSASLAVYYQLHQADIQRPFLEWLLSFSRNKVDLDILVVMRWSMALFTAVMVAVVYGLARKLWSRPLALLGTLFLLTDPHLLSVSRIIGHDALVTMLITASLLSFLCARRALGSDDWNSPSPPTPLPEGEGLGVRAMPWVWLILSGGLAGLGVLSKATAMFLIPFVGLIAVVDVGYNRARLKFWSLGLLVWGGSLWLAFVAGWPAAWVDPLLKTWDVINNAFLSSAGLEDADIQPFVTIPELGYSYYLVNGAYKLSVPVTIGLILAGIGGWQVVRRRPITLERLVKNDLFWLALFGLLFGLFMSLGVKRSPRYSLPAFPALGFVAAWGWLYLLRRFQPPLVVAGLGAAAMVLTLLYAPYYFTYYNPLLGGAITAPHVVRIGWGEGLDELGRWLDTQPDPYVDHLGARYTVAVNPFYQGQVSSPTSESLDYVAFYIKQSQSGYPTPEILAYFEQRGSLHRITLNGIDYAQVYDGPGMELVSRKGPGLPLAYRPDTIYAPIGQTLTVDLLWSNESQLDKGQAVTLNIGTEAGAKLESTSDVTEPTPGVWVSTHEFQLPEALPRGTYTLSVNGTSIGSIQTRLMEIPPDFQATSRVMAGLRLAGLKKEISGHDLNIDLAWQGWPAAPNDFTIFIQLLDANQQRVAGVDVLPERGFTTLDRKEIMLTHHTIPLPDDLQPDSYTILVGLYYFVGDQLINVGATPLEELVILQ